MGIPAVPTATTIVTQALKRAGRTNPSTTQITEAIDHALQEVKADIMLMAPTHPTLMTTATTVTTRGQQRYSIPEDSNEQVSIALLDGPDSWRTSYQFGTPSSITFPSSFTATADEIVGRYILVTSGAAIEDYREIVAYTEGTRTAFLDLDWLTTPTTGDTCLIVQTTNQLWPYDVSTEFERIQNQTALGRPTNAAVFDQEFLLYPVPDKSTYGLLNRYYVDLSKLDEDGELFRQLLREWRSIWIQGVAVKSMQRYDEDRYQSELAVYKLMLDSLTNQACTVTQVQFRDLV